MSAKEEKQTTKEGIAEDSLKPEKSMSLAAKLALIIIGLILLSGLLTVLRVGAVTYDFVKNPEEIIARIPDLMGAKLEKTGERTNILLLGAGDLSYDDGSELTDSIMLVSLDHVDKSVSMISIPRDLGVEIPSYGVTRVNVLYKLAKNRLGDKNAFKLIVPTIEQITCQPIHYYVKVDFIGFKRIINALGGVTVDVERTFTDHQYPTSNFGYQTVSFVEGPQWMDGETALQYVRSRHGNNEEGSDFARAARQQILISSLKEKVLSKDLLQDEKRLTEVIEALNEHYETDLTLKEMISLVAFAEELETASVHNMVLKEGPGELLYTPDEATRSEYYDGMAILLPDGNTFQHICRTIESFFADPEIFNSGIQIEILNGTNRIGLANKAATLVMQNGYKIFPIYGIRNTSYGYYENSYIYDHSELNANSPVVDSLKKLLGINRVVDRNSEPRYHDVDVTVVLGNDFYLEGLDEMFEGKASIEIDLNLLELEAVLSGS